jgi:hypothetical protein
MHCRLLALSIFVKFGLFFFFFFFCANILYYVLIGYQKIGKYFPIRLFVLEASMEYMDGIGIFLEIDIFLGISADQPQAPG